MEVLVGIFIVLVIWAALGHGIWLIFAALFRALFGGSQSDVEVVRPLNLQSHCKACGAALSLSDYFCQGCGQPQTASGLNELAEFNAAVRQFARWQQRGQVDAATAQTLQRLIEAERQRLSGTAAPSATQTAPASTPPSASAPVPVAPSAPAVTAPVFPTATTPLHPQVTAAAPLPKPEKTVVAPPPAPAAPSLSLGEMLTAFLEESSIRWGELIGGLLIIGCSLALVISLWAEISERPALKFGVFMTLTAGLFGLGFYSAHRWRLPTTSRGVLLTATLLVPLNFLAVTAFGRTEASGLGILLAEALAWLVFGGLVWLAGRVIAPARETWLTVGTQGAALALLLGKHLAPAGFAGQWHWRSGLLFGLLPVLSHFVSTGATARATKQEAEPSNTAVYGLFTVFGVSLFATVLPVGLLLLRTGQGLHAWRINAPLLAWLGLPALGAGWTLWRKLTNAEWAHERTAALSVALCGAGVLLGSTVLAFPLIWALVAVAALNLLVWSWAAWRYEWRAVRWLAWLQAVWLYLLLVQVALSRVSFGMENAWTLLTALFSQASAWALALVFVAFIGWAEWLRVRRAAALAAGAAAENGSVGLIRESEAAAWLAALASLALGSWHGFGVAGDPQHLVWLYGGFAAVTLGLAWRRSSIFLTAATLLLGLGVSVQACVFRYGWPRGWAHATLVSWLVFASAAAALTLSSLLGSSQTRRALGHPALLAAWLSVAGSSLALLTRLDGVTGAYVAPLLWVSGVGILYAWRGRELLVEWASGLLLNLAVTLSYAIWLNQHGGTVTSAELARLLQLNLLTAALYALAWRWVWQRLAAGSTAGSTSVSVLPSWMALQLRAVIGGSLVVLAGVALRLTLEPALVSQFARRLGDGLGWAVALLLGGSWWWLRRAALNAVLKLQQEAALRAGAETAAEMTPEAAAQPVMQSRRLKLTPAVVGYLAAGVLLASTLQHFERGFWLSYHTLLVVAVVGAWALLWLLLTAHRRVAFTTAQTVATVWANGLGGAGTALALGAYAVPGGPWRSVLALAALSGLAVGLALARRNGAYFYAAGLLTCLALTEWIFGYRHGDGTLYDVAMLNAAALALLALLSLGLELRYWRTEPPAQPLPAFHQFVVGWLVALTWGKVFIGLLRDFSGTTPLPIQSWTGGAALTTLAALSLACWWDARFAYRFATVYALALASCGVALDRQNWPADKLLVALTVTLSGYGLLTALLWRGRLQVAAGLKALRVPQLDWRGAAGLWWLSGANAWLALGAFGFSAATVLTEVRLSWRVAAASAGLLAPFAVGLVAQGAARLRRQTLAVALGVSAAVIWSWAWVGHTASQRVYERLVLALAWTLGGALVFYVLEAAERVNWARLGEWERATRRVVRGASLIGLGALVLTLLVEGLVLGLVKTETLPRWAETVVAVLLFGLGAAQIGFALWPGRDPLNWAAARRGRYIYAAELCAVLLLVHLRLTLPWLFGGTFSAYWPLIVLALAFVGVGVSEQLQRRGRLVLAEPLGRTGVFLPLLPSLGYWLADSRVDYTGVLLAVGLFYGLLSVMRQSFGFGLLAALAANGGWWHWLQRSNDLGFLAHPQVWLIPAALSVLLAAHLNRRQLSAEQLTTLRYTSLMVVYVSSTADIFLNGVGRSPWLPLVLAVLSVAGVLLGIALRVRAYLFLGAAFLLLALVTLVWHAALNLGWGWLWYVVGIGFGVFILYLFALFERKRAAVLGLVEQLKSWQA